MKEYTLMSRGKNPEACTDQSPHPDRDLIAEKLLISRATTTERFKSPNVYRAAEHLYAALYHPEDIDSLVEPNDKFPDRLDILKKPLSKNPLTIPSKEEFIAMLRHAMVSEVEFGECLSDDAQSQLRYVMEKSEHTVIWTDGDAEGVSEYDLPGSKEQLKKLAAAQVYNRMRRDIAQERGVDHKDVLSVIAIEGKMKFIPELVEKFKEEEIRRIVIIEDRVKNLVQAMGLIRETAPEMEVFPIWVRVGQFKDKGEAGKTIDEWEKELHALSDISGLSELLEQNNIFETGIRVASVFDLDGPLHDDDKRKKLQTEAVIRMLGENGWI